MCLLGEKLEKRDKLQGEKNHNLVKLLIPLPRYNHADTLESVLLVF